MKAEKAERQIFLGAIRLDHVNECLWQEWQRITLAPMKFANYGTQTKNTTGDLGNCSGDCDHAARSR